MRRLPYEHIEELLEDVTEIRIGIGGTLDIGTRYFDLAPMLWLDFLNADPQSARSMWSVYKAYGRAMEDLKDSIDELGYRHNMGDMEFLSRQDFLKRYPTELRSDAEELHAAMAEATQQEKVDAIQSMMASDKEERVESEKMPAKGPDIPFDMFVISIINGSLAQGSY